MTDPLRREDDCRCKAHPELHNHCRSCGCAVYITEHYCGECLCENDGAIW